MHSIQRANIMCHLAFAPPLSLTTFSRSAACHSVCERGATFGGQRASFSRIVACVSAPTVTDDTTSLSPRTQALIRHYISAPLYEASSSASADETDAILAGQAVGPASFTDAFPQLVSAAHDAILSEYPGICAPGGALHPEYRAEACWRDLAQFLAVAGGVAFLGGRVRQSALNTLRELYVEMKVPVPAMQAGLFTMASKIRAGVAPETAAAALDEVAYGLK